MTRTTAALVVALAIASAPAGRPPSRAIQVHAAVIDAEGASVGGLTRSDFDVFVDGVPRAVESVTPAASPLSVVLLLDVSASMRMGDLVSGVVLQRALEQWFPLSLAPGDRARIGVVARRVDLSPRFTSDRREIVAATALARQIPKIDRQGPSPLWDAVEAAVEALEWEGGHRAVVLFTDGRASGNRVSVREAARLAATAAVSVHIVAERDAPATIVQADGSSITIAPALALRWLAEETGGAYHADRRFPWSDPGPLFARILKDLHGAYAIGFADGGDGRMHTVEIRVRVPGLTVRARRSFLASYAAGGPSPAGSGSRGPDVWRESDR